VEIKSDLCGLSLRGCLYRLAPLWYLIPDGPAWLSWHKGHYHPATFDSVMIDSDRFLTDQNAAGAKDMAVTSFSAWCCWDRPKACLQTKVCWLQASTSSLNVQEWASQTPSPRCRATATLTDSLSICSPQEVMGKALSQSPEWRSVAARNKTF